MKGFFQTFDLLKVEMVKELGPDQRDALLKPTVSRAACRSFKKPRTNRRPPGLGRNTSRGVLFCIIGCSMPRSLDSPSL